VFRGPTPYVHHETSEGTWYSRCGIAAGPDGNLWFTQWEADRIARVTPGGVVSEYPPTAVVLRIAQRGASAVAVRLRCPAGAVRECRGTLRLHAFDNLTGRERRVGVRRFAVAPAARADLVVPISAVGRRQLRRWRALSLNILLVPSAHSLAGAARQELVMRVPARVTLPPVTG